MGIVSLELNGRTLKIETGKLAKQAQGSALVTYGETVVLVSACGAKDAREGVDFLPLTVEYREKTYAAGKIPGGFFKREGRPTTQETLACRLVDRSIRPMFPDGFNCETQVIALVLAVDKANSPEMLALIGASTALCLSDIPYTEPVAGVKMGYIDGKHVVNPTMEQLEKSLLDLTVAGTRDAVCMVESGVKELSEDILIESISMAHDEIKRIIEAQDRLVAECGKSKWEFAPKVIDKALMDSVEAFAKAEMSTILHLDLEKKDREARIDGLRDQAIEKFYKDGEDEPSKVTDIKTIIHDLEKHLLRRMIIDEGRRADGRKTNEIRPISCEVAFLPRVHGSALFTRGQTQSLGAVTLGSSKDEQRIDGLMEETFERFILHYNFPPFATGEIKRIGGTSRREIGHGHLALRALQAVLPTPDVFPYTIRVVSEILESNGSSSMATVCSGTLALLDAGVPLKAPVSGIAMGLITEGDEFAVLSDILGMEDHLGDMDFKVTGTSAGVTALQMDIKVKGLSREILEKALKQAREGRMHILGKMNEAIADPRKELSPYAPRIYTLKIDPEKIGTVIGPGGKTIRGITGATGVEIDIDDTGTILVFTMDAAQADRAVKMIEDLTAEVEVGKVYEGKVVRVTPFGAFVEILPGKDGLVHISELEHGRVNKVTDVLDLGDKVMVKVMEIDEMGRVNLSRRVLLPRPPDMVVEAMDERDRNRDDRPPRGDSRPPRGDSRPPRGDGRRQGPPRGGR